MLNEKDWRIYGDAISRYSRIGINDTAQIVVEQEKEIEKYRELIEDLRNKITEREFKIKQLEIKINNTGELLQEKVEKTVFAGEDDTVVIIKGPGKVASVEAYFQEDGKCQ